MIYGNSPIKSPIHWESSIIQSITAASAPIAGHCLRCVGGGTIMAMGPRGHGGLGSLEHQDVPYLDE